MRSTLANGNGQLDCVAQILDANAESKIAASTRLVEIARERYTFGVSTVGESFALPRLGARVVLMLRGGKTSLRAQLANDYFQRYRRVPPQQALADCLLVLEGLAQESTAIELHQRVARDDDGLWVDVGDKGGLTIQVTGEGWCVLGEAPMLFKRTVLNAALPMPVRGGTSDELWNLLNVAIADRPLVMAWLIAALFPDIPHPVLAFFGEQGTGKTTAQKLLVNAIDPGPVPTRKPPRDAETWVTAISGSWVIGLDNLSDVQPWLSDSLCRAVTGDGDVRRKLYTDAEYAIFAYRRCICLTSIDLGSLRGDLGERVLPIQLDKIDDHCRLLDQVLAARWREAHPRILGVILDLAAGVLRVLQSVQLAPAPRMADFARILSAVDRVLGTHGLDEYVARQKSLARDSLSGDPFIEAVSALRDFRGTTAQLLAQVTPEKPSKDWPRNARAATQRLRRQAASMRKAGWTVEDDGGRNIRNTAMWTLIAPAGEARIPDSSHSSIQVSQPLAAQTHESTSRTSLEHRTSRDDDLVEDGAGEWMERL